MARLKKTRTVIHRREFEKRRETLTDVRKRLTLAERTGIDACSTDQHRNVLAWDCYWPRLCENEAIFLTDGKRRLAVIHFRNFAALLLAARQPALCEVHGREETNKTSEYGNMLGTIRGIINLSSMIETWFEDLLQWKAFIANIIESYGLPIRPVIELLPCIDDYQDSSKGNCVGSH